MELFASAMKRSIEAPCHDGTFGMTESRRGGFTMVEVAIYMGVLAILASPIILAVLGSTRMMEEGNLIASISERNRVATRRIADEFQLAISDSFSVSNSGATLQFTVPDTFTGTVPTSGTQIRYDFLPDPEDPDNGVDDDSNGVADERILVRTNLTTREQVTIGADFDPDMTGFVAQPDGVTITVTSVGWTKGSQALTKMTQTVEVHPKN